MANYLDKEWLTPWEAVQVLVAADPAFGPDVADLAPEKRIRDLGVPAVLIGLHRDDRLNRFLFQMERVEGHDLPGDDQQSSVASQREFTHGNRAVGAFREAIERIGREWAAGRIEASRLPANHDEMGALSAYLIDFRRGSLECWPPGIQLRLRRNSIVRCCVSVTEKNSAANSGTGRRGGVSDWGPVIIEIVKRLLEKNGPISADDPEWNSQSKVVEAVRCALSKRYPNKDIETDGPQNTTLKKFVRLGLEKADARLECD